MEQDNQYIRFDWAIKHILRDKANFDILEGFISVLLGEEVKIVELLESESNQENERDNYDSVDIMSKNSKGRLIRVMMQLVRRLDYYEKIYFGKCKVFRERINIGDLPDEVMKVYSLNVLYCDYGKGDDYVYKGDSVFKGIHTGNDLLVKLKEAGVIVTHLPEEVFPEYYLVRVNAYAYDQIPHTPLDEWMYYLRTGDIKEGTHTPGLQQASEKLRVYAMTPKELRSYEAYMDNIMVQNDVLDTAYDEGYDEGYKLGLVGKRAEGHLEGRAEAIKEVVQKLFHEGMEIREICQLTGLSPEALGKL